MNSRAVQIAAVGVLGVIALYWLGRRAEMQREADAQGTTTSDKGGLTTTPIKTSAVAVVATPFRALESIVRKVASIPSSIVQGGSWNRLQPYTSPQQAEAAYASPLRPDYVPTVRALDSVVYLPGAK